MAQNIIDTKIREAYDTEANWIKYNPVLLSGQLAYSSDKYGKHKIGNGASRWSQLQYATLGWGDIAEKPSTFSPSTHTHPVNQVTGLTPSAIGAAASNHTHDLVTKATLADKATYINDPNDNRPISISYVNEIDNALRFPAWGDRNTMVTVTGENLRTSIDAAKSSHTHPTGNTTTLGLTKLYADTGAAIDGTITQKGITDALDKLKYLCAPLGHTHKVSQITDFPNIKAITNTQIDSLANL